MFVGIERRYSMKKIELTEGQLDKIRKLAKDEDHWGSRFIAKELGISRVVAMRIMAEMGIDNSHKGKLTRKQIKLIGIRLKQGISLRKIAAEIKISVGQVKLGRNLLGLTNKDSYDISTINTDIVGKKFGKLTVLRPSRRDADSRSYYMCKCECNDENSEIEVYRNHLASSHTTSCGCNHKEIRAITKYTPQMSSIMSAFRYYSDGDLTVKQFVSLATKDCHYCGCKASRVVNNRKNRKLLSKAEKKKAEWIYNGLDAVDPSKPHNLDNVVPCCLDCNIAKMKKTQDEFKQWLTRTYSHYVLGITI